MSGMRLTPVLALLAGLLAACGGSAAPAPAAGSGGVRASAAAAVPATEQAIVAGARKEGQLTLVWGDGAMGGDAGAKLLADGLNKRYGLNLKVQYTPGPSMPDMSAKILQE